MSPHIVVLDVGKTLSKASLWTADGVLLDRCTRANERCYVSGERQLDAAGIEQWFAESLTRFARQGAIGSIFPVAHGAAVAVVRDGGLVAATDYENAAQPVLRAAYDAERDPFQLTGSPALPDGLNLGFQLHALEARDPKILSGATLLPWPQYWAWVLCGVAASEVTSLGCHSDLWRPLTAEPSQLSVRRGWADAFAPVRRADDVLGTLTPAWMSRCGLSGEVRVCCGIHDSNAALVAARAFPEVAGREATVLSTGTWFVSMRTPATSGAVAVATLDEARDCLFNVDAYGRAIPSARFMGGREIEMLTGIDARRIDISVDQPALLAAVPSVLRSGAMALPTFAPGVGPFPHAPGSWVREPADAHERRAAVSLYAALIADASLDLIGARENLIVEGRFADAQVFVRALASLRPDMRVYAANAQNDVAFGALRLVEPKLSPQGALTRVAPLVDDLGAYSQAWRSALRDAALD